ncbi:MAG TPA: hypothetical protein PLH19_13695 [Anaerolineae bacterium]|nr:hypothetical protein [Anaerolineae bacterium]HQH39572.1 hypothetical protein [Anaerolineae bacterium]
MQTSGPPGRLSSHLASQIEAQTRDPDWTLAHFAFVASVTTLAAECDIAHSPSMSVATTHSLPRARLAFLGESAELLANYATFLVDPGSEIELLVAEAQRGVAETAFAVLTMTPQWQMVFRGRPEDVDSGLATPLTDNDLPAMQALAKNEHVELLFATKKPFAQGPVFGIWEKHKLVAMGTTDLRLPGAVQIGNIIAHQSPNGHVYRANIAAALIKAYAGQNVRVFMIVDQHDEEALQLFTELGFTPERPMYRMRCVLKEV